MEPWTDAVEIVERHGEFSVREMVWTGDVWEYRRRRPKYFAIFQRLTDAERNGIALAKRRGAHIRKIEVLNSAGTLARSINVS